MRDRRIYPPIIVLVLIGVGTLSQTLSGPRLESVRGVDIVSLTGSGFCFGIAFAFLILTLGGRLSGPGEGAKQLTARPRLLALVAQGFFHLLELVHGFAELVGLLAGPDVSLALVVALREAGDGVYQLIETGREAALVVQLTGLHVKFVLTGSRLEVQPDDFGVADALLDVGLASRASSHVLV
jgi:hypothetical protein